MVVPWIVYYSKKKGGWWAVIMVKWIEQEKFIFYYGGIERLDSFLFPLFRFCVFHLIVFKPLVLPCQFRDLLLQSLQYGRKLEYIESSWGKKKRKEKTPNKNQKDSRFNSKVKWKGEMIMKYNSCIPGFSFSDPQPAPLIRRHQCQREHRYICRKGNDIL